MSRGLVLARVGAGSLHPTWIDRGTPRDWDLHLVPYQPIQDQTAVDCVTSEVIPGPKWSGLRERLNGWDGWREYDLIWLPDDDIYASQDTISRMFAVARAVGLDLFAPALHESSYFAHFLTMVNRRFSGRWVGFVEIMVPGFSRSALERLLPTLPDTDTGWGRGLDSGWPKPRGYEGVGVIDSTPVLHTRPVGGRRDLEVRARLHDDSDGIVERYDGPQ